MVDLCVNNILSAILVERIRSTQKKDLPGKSSFRRYIEFIKTVLCNLI